MSCWHKVRRGGYGKKDKLLRYSIQVSYLGILLREGLLTEEEYEKCMSSLKGDYGIVSDILVD